MNSDYHYEQILNDRVVSKCAHLRSTPGQLHSDKEFLLSVQEAYIEPLVEELARQIEGFYDMDVDERVIATVALNAPLAGLGDRLLLNGMTVYSGVLLGREEQFPKRPFGDSEPYTTYQYRPRFSNETPPLFRGVLTEDGELISDLENFLSRERWAYDPLPAAYRAALLCMHISSRVIARPQDVCGFVMGSCLGSDSVIETRRFSVTPRYGVTSLYNGWDIRVREPSPGAAFWTELRTYIQEYQQLLGEADSPLFEAGNSKKETRKKRQPNPKTELACRYIYEQERKGVTIDGRKKNGVGFKKLVIDMELKFGNQVKHYDDPDSLRRTYDDWKKRHHLS